MSKHDFPFLGSEESSKFILSRFNFKKILQVTRLPPPRPLPPNWLSLCPRFVKTRAECYAYDVGVPEILQFVFYCSVLQEVVRFNIVPPVVVQDLTKNLEEFNWKGFKEWLDFISPTLIACQDSELRGRTPLGGGEMESSESLLFPLPYPRDIQAMGASKPPPKERRRAYPSIAKVMTLMRS